MEYNVFIYTEGERERERERENEREREVIVYVQCVRIAAINVYNLSSSFTHASINLNFLAFITNKAIKTEC